jgi:hypothetical protein
MLLLLLLLPITLSSVLICRKVNKSPKAPAVRVKENRVWGLGGSSRDVEDLDRSDQTSSSSQGYDVSGKKWLYVCTECVQVYRCTECTMCTYVHMYITA